MPIAPFSDLNVTQDHEEKLRTESMALFHADAELSRRLAVVETAMALIFAYTFDHKSRSEHWSIAVFFGRVRAWTCPSLAWRPYPCE